MLHPYYPILKTELKSIVGLSSAHIEVVARKSIILFLSFYFLLRAKRNIFATEKVNNHREGLRLSQASAKLDS